MEKKQFLDKYPIQSLKITKEQTTYNNVDEIINYLKNVINNHKIATYISTFEHYAHTKSIDGKIQEDIKDAQNIIFCFGAAIPNSEILAIRPRSIGICEYENHFSINFMDAPKEELTMLMTKWVKDIKNKG